MMPFKTDLCTDLILRIFSLHQRLIVAGDALSAPQGLSAAKWKVLGGLALSESPPTVSQVAKKMGLSRQAVQRLCNDLQALGMIVPITNPRHKRACCWQLTERGENNYNQLMEKQKLWLNRVGQGIERDDIERCSRILEQFSSQIDD